MDNFKILEEKNKEALQAGGEKRIKKQRDAGKLTARERIEYLADQGSFIEFDKFATHRCSHFGLDKKKNTRRWCYYRHSRD